MCRVLKHEFGVVHVHRTSSNLLEHRPHVEERYTPCYLCDDVVLREGSRRFDVLEPPRTRARAPCTPCFPCNDVASEGSVQANHPNLLGKTSTRPASSVVKWFEKVRGGSMRLNHPKRVYEHPAHLVSSVKL